jgi:hypothetical protein
MKKGDLLHRGRAQRLTFAFVLALSAGPTIAQTPVGTGAFPKVEAIETQLKRGVSTKADVQRLLGVPNGSGGALLPGYGDKRQQLEPYQIWYYEDIEVTDTKAEEQLVTMNMRQQILTVFFRGELFHGYFWTSNSGLVQAR